MKIRNLIAIVCLFVLLSACKNPLLIYEMASVDRDLVTALLETRGNDGAKAAVAVTTYKVSWGTFTTRNRSLENYHGWDSTSERIESLIERAESKARYGEIEGAHAVLENIRMELFSFRSKNEIDYFPDHLTEFYEVMGPIFDATSDGALDPAEIDFIDKTLGNADRVWEKVMAADFERRAFRFSKDKEKKLVGLLDFEKNALDNIGRVLNTGGGRTPLVHLIKEAEIHYTEILGMFGTKLSLSSEL